MASIRSSVWFPLGVSQLKKGQTNVLLYVLTKHLGTKNSQVIRQCCTLQCAVRLFPTNSRKLKILAYSHPSWVLGNLFYRRIILNTKLETVVQIVPLSAVPLLHVKSHTYLPRCSCRCCIILLLFCNEKPTSSSSQPLLLHLLANKGLHYLQLHGSHQLQNCRYCNTQNTLKRNKRNNYMCKTSQLNFCRKEHTERRGLP